MVATVAIAGAIVVVVDPIMARIGTGGIMSGVAMIGILLEVLVGEMLTCCRRHNSNGVIPGHSRCNLHLLRHRLSTLHRSGLS